MPLVAVADVVNAAVTYLKTFSEISTIVSTAAGWTNADPTAPTSGARISGALGKN